MLSKQNRLRKNDVKLLLKKGVKIKSDNFFAIIRANKLGVNRFCVIISKKLKLKSVHRTQLRRKIYAAAGEIYAVLKINKSFDAALCPNNQMTTKKSSDITKEIIKIFKKWEKIS